MVGQEQGVDGVAWRVFGGDFLGESAAVIGAAIIHRVERPRDIGFGGRPIQLANFGPQGIFAVGIGGAFGAQAVLLPPHGEDDADFQRSVVGQEKSARLHQFGGDLEFQRRSFLTRPGLRLLWADLGVGQQGVGQGQDSDLVVGFGKIK